MKKSTLLVLILCQIQTLYAQSENTLTTEELRKVHKQQIRLIYCDSSRELLKQSVEVCNSKKIVLSSKVKTLEKDIELIDDYNSKLRAKLSEADKRIKKLEKREKLLKIGFIGSSSIAIALIILSAAG